MKKVMLVVALAGFAFATVNAQNQPAKASAPAKKEQTTATPAVKSQTPVTASTEKHHSTKHKSSTKTPAHAVKREEKPVTHSSASAPSKEKPVSAPHKN